MLKAPPQEISQIQLALERSHRVSPFRLLLYLFWGLILAKCCLVQWAIIVYEASINGFLYIWLPTLAFGGICTFVYAKLSLEEFFHAPVTSRLLRSVWTACATSVALFAIGGIGFHGFSPFVMPALLASIMGMGYYIHSVIDHRALFRNIAYAWWASAALLFYFNDSASLALLSLCILLFQVTPSALLYRKAIQQSKEREKTAEVAEHSKFPTFKY